MTVTSFAPRFVAALRRGEPLPQAIADRIDQLATVYLTRPSTAVRGLELNLAYGVVFVDWHSGSSYAYKVSRREMLALLVDRDASLGQWVNRKLDLRNPLPM